MSKKTILSVLCILTVIGINFNASNVSAKIIKEEFSNEIKTYYVSTHEENQLVISLIKSRREPEVKIVYSGDMASSEYEYLEDISNFSNAKNYLVYSDYGYGITYGNSMLQRSRTDKELTILFQNNFLETDEETQYVYDKIRSAIKDNISNLKTDYDKAYWAYHWVIDNLYYDKTYENRTPYDGLIGDGTVCSGYATLYYAVATELGLECRYISGTVDEDGSHAWNIVKINDEWYCVDSTWGDSIYGDKFFLKSKDTFSSFEYKYHRSEMYDYYINEGDKFATNDFDINVPTNVSAVLPSVYNIKMDVLNYNTLSAKEKYKFLLANPDNASIWFTSSDTSIAKVNKNGVIVGLNKGDAIITAYNSDLNFSQSINITIK